MSASRLLNLCLVTLIASCLWPYALAQSSSSNSSKKTKAPSTTASIDDGAVINGVYSNRSIGLTCKIPPGWVLRTEEMNSRDEAGVESGPASPGPDSPRGYPHGCGKVLLAVFSRPPEARGEEINSSVLIAAESMAAYPGLKDAAQYFGPLTEVAKAQGFAVDEEPYEFAVGSRNLVRGDFHKDVGTRVMRQSTLVFLAQGYAVSITVIGGTEDEVEELIDGLNFGAGKPAAK